MRNYEFQNPAWYLGRAVVSKSMNVLKNSIYGFKELAGSKIYLMPHQVNTIMRCLQESPCRYMLADEVGMGKTVEAISIYKIFTLNESKTKALILVPKALKEQWISELLLKFNIPVGTGANQNSVFVKSIEEVGYSDLSVSWDFLIIDEVHKYLFIKDTYETMHSLSAKSKNILLLSATPVQQKKEEYLDLLRLLLPNKYDGFGNERFSELIEKQTKIIQKTALILDELGDYEEEISCVTDGADPHESEECKEIFEEIYDDLSDICDDLDDIKLSDLLDEIRFDDEDLGVYRIKVIISYICSNYQIESNIIRNRRKILEDNEDDIQLMATRELVELEYALEGDKALYEQITYNDLSNWIVSCIESNSLDIEQDIKQILSRFFSSPWAFEKSVIDTDMPMELKENARKWLDAEKYNVDHIKEILNDPDKYEDSYSTRLVVILNALFDEFYDNKVVLFSDLVSDIKLQATDEHNDSILRQAVSQLEVLLTDFEESYSGDTKASKDFYEYVRSQTADDCVESVYELSDQALFQVNELVETKITEARDLTEEILVSKRKLEKQISEQDSYLTLDINEKELQSIFSKIKKVEKKIVEDKVVLSKLDQKRASANARVMSTTAEFNKYVEAYLATAEMIDSTERTLKYSNMALQILDRYQVELQKRKADLLSNTITECYKKLANKKNLINRIEMDPESLNVKYVSGDGLEVGRDSLSAGEQQLMVISILWALL